MRKQYAKALILLVFMISFLPMQSASADLGPKPTMYFNFTQELSGTQVTIVSGELFECKQSDCSDAKPLEQVALQGFGCEALTCHARAYGFSDYHRLEIEFSDGKTRQSNIFKTAELDSIYKVTIRQDDLLVEPQFSSTDYAPYLIILLCCCCCLFGIVAMIIVVVMMVVRSRNKML
jgi:hypothetical protein